MASQSHLDYGGMATTLLSRLQMAKRRSVATILHPFIFLLDQPNAGKALCGVWRVVDC